VHKISHERTKVHIISIKALVKVNREKSSMSFIFEEDKQALFQESFIK